MGGRSPSARPLSSTAWAAWGGFSGPASPRSGKLSGGMEPPESSWPTSQPAAPRVGSPGPAPAAAPAACASHATNLSVDLCERCGDFMCALCRTYVEGRRYCPRCFDLLYARGAFAFSHRDFRQPANALLVGILSLVSVVPFFCIQFGVVTLPLSIAAFVIGANALREISRRPDLPGRDRAIAGMACGAGSLLLVIGIWVAILLSSQS